MDPGVSSSQRRHRLTTDAKHHRAHHARL